MLNKIIRNIFDMFIFLAFTRFSSQRITVPALSPNNQSTPSVPILVNTWHLQLYKMPSQLTIKRCVLFKTRRSNSSSRGHMFCLSLGILVIQQSTSKVSFLKTIPRIWIEIPVLFKKRKKLYDYDWVHALLDIFYWYYCMLHCSMYSNLDEIFRYSKHFSSGWNKF